MIDPVQVTAEPTPNPNSVKFSLNRVVTEAGSESYDTPQEAVNAPLAKRLFEIKGVTSIFFLKNFVTVVKDSESGWDEIVPRAKEILKDYFG
jgi:Scaffold protein Nfu/NifU N terminal